MIFIRYDGITKYSIRDPQKVLIRLKVDHAGFAAFNFPRFTAQFATEVANAPSIILPTKKRKELLRAGGGRRTDVQGENGDEDLMKQILADGAEDDIPKIRIEDLVNETLASGKHSLSLLTESEVAQVWSSSMEYGHIIYNIMCDRLWMIL